MGAERNPPSIGATTTMFANAAASGKEQIQASSPPLVLPISNQTTSPQLQEDGAKVTQEKPTPMKKKGKKKKSSKSRTSSSSASSSLPIVRRLRREWQDAIEHGYAYDWINGKAITNKDTTIASTNNCIRLGPWGSNLLVWHFSMTGPTNSAYERGIYHGRIMLPKDYPLSPPRIQVLTPSGRFIPGRDICTTASNYHPESWTPKWTLLGMVQTLQLHFLAHNIQIGGMSASYEDRTMYALKSRDWQWKSVNHTRMIEQGMFDKFDDDKLNSTARASLPQANFEASEAAMENGTANVLHIDSTDPAMLTRSNDQSTQTRQTNLTPPPPPPPQQFIEGVSTTVEVEREVTTVTKKKRKTKRKKKATKVVANETKSTVPRPGRKAFARPDHDGSQLVESDRVPFLTKQTRRRWPPSLTVVLMERGIQILQSPPRLLALGLLFLFLWLNR